MILHHDLCDPIPFINVTSSDRTIAIKKLEPSMSAGRDFIPDLLVRGYAELLAPTLATIFKESLEFRIFTNFWENGSVVSIHR